MVRSTVLTLLALILLRLALPAAHATETLAGVYQGQIDGVDARLSLSESGFVLTGQLQLFNGYAIRLNGQRQGETAAGAAASAAGAASFELARSANGVYLTLEETAPLTGRLIRVRYEFVESASNAQRAGADDTADGDRDMRLVGRWLGSELRYAGDMVLRVAVLLQLSGDGRYLQSDDAASQTLSDSAQPGQWRVEQGKLQLRADGRSEWTVLGFYQLRGDDMLLIDGEGHAQSWHRQ